MAKKKSKVIKAAKNLADKVKSKKEVKILTPGKPKDDYALEITDKSNNGYLEFNPEGKKCKIYVGVPNKVGKTLRVRQIGKEGGSVEIRTNNGFAKITPNVKFIDMIKMGNVWALVPRRK